MQGCRAQPIWTAGASSQCQTRLPLPVAADTPPQRRGLLIPKETTAFSKAQTATRPGLSASQLLSRFPASQQAQAALCVRAAHPIDGITQPPSRTGQPMEVGGARGVVRWTCQDLARPTEPLSGSIGIVWVPSAYCTTLRPFRGSGANNLALRWSANGFNRPPPAAMRTSCAACWRMAAFA